MVSAETSILTIISTPGIAYRTNLAFLQLVFGYLVARVVVSFIFIPRYFAGELFTAYQLVERRFGRVEGVYRRALSHQPCAGRGRSRLRHFHRH